jgi:hypothetical protein
VRLEKVDTDIWIVEGSEIVFLGLAIGTRMTVIRFDDNLLIHSPVAIDDEIVAELAMLGTVRHIVAPNKFHHLFVPAWLVQFPDAQVYAGPGLAEKRTDIRFDQELAVDATYDWSSAIAHDIFGPNRLFEETVFFHRTSKTLILTDLIANTKTDNYNFFQRLFARFDGIDYPNGTTPRLYRWSMKSKTAGRKVVQTMIDWQPERVIISHGEWFRNNGTEELKNRLQWIL